jgi:enolase
MADIGKIERVWAREVLNFRGHPAIEAEVVLSDGSRGRAAVPAGISTGSHEARPLFDGDSKRFAGKGVLKAMENVREVIAPALLGMPASPQQDIDERLLELDGTTNKSKLGANAILATSLAAAHAAAATLKVPLYRYVGGKGPFYLPVPTFDVLAGGAHATGSVDIQEFLVIPAGLCTFREALQAGAEVYEALVEVLRTLGHSVRLASGPLAVPLASNEEGVTVIATAIERAGYKLGEECFIGLDVAASEIYYNGRYVLAKEGRSLTSEEMSDLWAGLLEAYPIVSIEDGMSEDDWEGWQALTRRIGHRVQLVGDDLFTTNPERVRKGVMLGAANAVLIKPNQIGTLTETLETMRIAHEANWAAMLSSRSGEAEDTTIADLAVLGAAGQIKMGPPCLHAVVKYNRLLRIEEELGDTAEYAGRKAYKVWAR